MLSPQKKKQLRALLRHKPGMAGLGVIGLLVLTAIFADLIATVDPLAQDYSLKFIPPLWQDGGQWPHIFGTDVLGRDQFSRIVYGARLSLMIGFFAVLIGLFIGVPIGLIAGFYGGRIDNLFMRIIDVMLAFPALLLAICIVAILGPSLENSVIAIGIVAVPTYARVVRSSVLSEKEKEYVLADIALGKKKRHVLFGSILPNVLSPILVISTLSFGGAVLDAAGLSFLGLGAQPPTPEWGALITEGKKSVFQASWLVLYPGFAILVTVIGFNLFGDALRDIFDPKRSRS